PVTGHVLVRAPSNQTELIKRLNAEIRRAVELLSWVCPDTHAHYKGSDSHKQLLFWASHDGIATFQ
ncbi:hypothetical protein V7G70_18500, partial [Acinetobacter pittii]